MQSQAPPPSSLGANSSGPTGATPSAPSHKPIQGGRFDFDDGGMYCGGWEDGKAHGHGVCTGLKGQGEYSGSWNYGFEVSGVYTWPGGSTYEGHWQNGKRHGLGVETRGRWIYRGEWTQGFKGRYGVRQSLTSAAKYDGTWANGLQDGYGSETYADAGTYQGQWLRGMRHGYGVRTSAPFGMASRLRPKSNLRSSMSSLRSGVDGGGVGGAADPAADRDKRLDDGRGGFVLKARSDEPPTRRRSFSERSTNIKKSLFQGLRLKKQHSTGELEKRGTTSSLRSTGSSASWRSTESSQSGMTNNSQHTDSNASFVAEDEHLDASVTETYMGEWKNDKRSGFGISERSDGLKYEGEWFNNKKYGYGVTTFKDGSKEEGKYKNNVLITSQKKKHLFLIRSAKFRERIEAAVNAAQRASKIALQKADIAISRTSTARGKAELADMAAIHAREDAEYARIIAKQLAPDFQPCSETMRPMLPALGRLTPQPPPTHPTTNKPHSAYVTANNVAGHHPSSHHGHHPMSRESHSDTGHYLMDRDAPTPTPTSPNSLTRMEDFAASLALPTTDLTRRPSVAIGGVRSPKADENSSIMMKELMPANHMAFPQSRPPASVQHGAHYAMAAPTTMASPYGPPQGNPSFDSGIYPGVEEVDSRATHLERGRSSLRRGGPPMPGYRGSGAGGQPGSNPYMDRDGHNPSFNFQQAMNDHFDHYKRTPSRDRSRDPSMDRFSRSSRMSLARTTETYSRGHSPASSVVSGSIHPRSLSRQRGGPPALTPSSSIRMDMTTPTNESIGFGGTNQRRPTLTHSQERSPGNGSIPGTPVPMLNNLQAQSPQPTNSVEEMLLRQRLGQEIPKDYSINSPKRTESLYIAPSRKKEAAAPMPVPKRKKSLPDAAAAAAVAASVMSREEASLLSSQRREELRRQAEEAERYRANPFLYFVSPQVKAFFVRQQLKLILLVINVSLAFLFFKLLT